MEANRSKALPKDATNAADIEVDEAYKTILIEGEQQPRQFLQFDNWLVTRFLPIVLYAPIYI